MNEAEKLTKDTVSNGGVLALLYFDIHAANKEAVQELGTGFINSVIQRPDVVFAYGEIEEPFDAGEKKNWTSSIELKVLTKSFFGLANICMDHCPYNVEILQPNEIKLPLAQAHELLWTMSTITAEYKRYILMKLAKPEELASIQETMRYRAEKGREIMGKKAKASSGGGEKEPGKGTQEKGK